MSRRVSGKVGEGRGETGKVLNLTCVHVNVNEVGSEDWHMQVSSCRGLPSSSPSWALKIQEDEFGCFPDLTRDVWMLGFHFIHSLTHLTLFIELLLHARYRCLALRIQHRETQ